MQVSEKGLFPKEFSQLCVRSYFWKIEDLENKILFYLAIKYFVNNKFEIIFKNVIIVL